MDWLLSNQITSDVVQNSFLCELSSMSGHAISISNDVTKRCWSSVTCSNVLIAFPGYYYMGLIYTCILTILRQPLRLAQWSVCVCVCVCVCLNILTLWHQRKSMRATENYAVKKLKLWFWKKYESYQNLVLISLKIEVYRFVQWFDWR